MKGTFGNSARESLSQLEISVSSPNGWFTCQKSDAGSFPQRQEKHKFDWGMCQGKYMFSSVVGYPFPRGKAVSFSLREQLPNVTELYEWKLTNLIVT